MGWSIKRANKAIGSVEPKKSYKSADKVSYGTRGRNENVQIPHKQEIDGYDYKSVTEDKGSLRKNKAWGEANDIAKNPDLSEAEKKFQLQQMINSERMHQNKFKPDTDRKNYLRDQRLGKTNKTKDFEQYTDGSLRTKD